MSIEGYYYLHQNGSLIYKPGSDSIVDIRDSNLCLCAWPLNPQDRGGAWDICVEGLALGANRERVIELAAKWGCDDADADRYAEHLGVTIGRDGNMWCATPPAFVNLQESAAGFGETKLEAMADLAKGLKLSGGTMWRATFQDLLKQHAESVPQ